MNKEWFLLQRKHNYYIYSYNFSKLQIYIYIYILTLHKFNVFLFYKKFLDSLLHNIEEILTKKK